MVIKNITNVGPNPIIDIAYNPTNKLMYIANKDVSRIPVINSSSIVVKNITNIMPGGYRGIAYNSNNNFMYVTQTNRDSVSVINSS